MGRQKQSDKLELTTWLASKMVITKLAGMVECK